MVAITNATLIRAAAVPLQKKLGLNAVLLAFMLCSFAATFFNAVYGECLRKYAVHLLEVISIYTSIHAGFPRRERCNHRKVQATMQSSNHAIKQPNPNQPNPNN